MGVSDWRDGVSRREMRLDGVLSDLLKPVSLFDDVSCHGSRCLKISAGLVMRKLIEALIHFFTLFVKLKTILRNSIE